MKNRHNATCLAAICDESSIKAGKFTYGPIHAVTFRGNEANLRIGDFCAIAGGVKFLLGGEHPTGTISSYPFRQMVLEESVDTFSKGDIIIDHDVWIGQDVLVLSGVHIGQGAVIGAGAVVSGLVPPYAVAGGVPAKVIRYRFSQPVIDYLLTLDYGKLDESLIRRHVDDLYREIDGMELEEIKKLYEWFPKKEHSSF